MVRAPAVSIVIPAFNEEKLLADSLRAVKSAAAQAFDAAGLGWELVVCDNNSSDRTAEIARTEGARVVFEPINQIGRARNTGAAAATGKWLLFIDADSHPSPALLADAAALTRRTDLLIAGAAIKLDADGFLPRLCAWTWNWASRLRGLVAGSFILVRRSSFQQVGGFDPRYFAGEEIDLALRLRRAAGGRRGGKTIILHRHPLLSSARKFRLYRKREFLRFLLISVLRPRKTLSSREACTLWYDGRR